MRDRRRANPEQTCEARPERIPSRRWRRTRRTHVNKDRNFNRASLQEFIRGADARLNEYLKRLGDVEDGATSGGARTKNLAEEIAALSEKRGRYQAMLT